MQWALFRVRKTPKPIINLILRIRRIYTKRAIFATDTRVAFRRIDTILRILRINTVKTIGAIFWINWIYRIDRIIRINRIYRICRVDGKYGFCGIDTKFRNYRVDWENRVCGVDGIGGRSREYGVTGMGAKYLSKWGKIKQFGWI